MQLLSEKKKKKSLWVLGLPKWYVTDLIHLSDHLVKSFFKYQPKYYII